MKPGGRRAEYKWEETMTFKTSDEYFATDFYKELKEVFTNRRKHLIESQSAMVYYYTCKNANRKRFLPCPKSIKVTIENDTTAVTVEEVYTHEHILNVEYEQKKASQFYWSENSSAIVRECLEVKKSPKYILNKLREGKFFERCGEPTKLQLYNKISQIKKRIPGYVPKQFKRRRGSTGRPKLWDTDLPKSELDMLKKAKQEERKQLL